VWPRSAKSIDISPETRLALGLEAEELSPSELISAILRAPVDLLYNGGIGTYVKATTESDADVGDRVNDDLRVDGKDLRCRVVAEGGNLGFTQRGRIEFALDGGRINTDFIDNSAGVDTSDHEVNLKILLGLGVARGELTMDERNALLADVEADVVRHVLYDNFLQAQILSQEAVTSAHHMEAYEDLMVGLETREVLDRDLEALPNAEEMAERRRTNRGMTRPELAVLLAYAKQSLTNALLASSLPDSAYLETDLRGYFPPKVVERFGPSLNEHPLRRELIAMLVANDVVNSQGITFVSRVVTETGADAADVTRAYRIARDVTGAVERWEEIEALVGALEPALLDDLMEGVDRLVEVTARWYLQHVPGQLGRAIEAHERPFRAFATAVGEVAPAGWRQERERAAWALMDRGVPEGIARAHVLQPFLVHGPNVADVALATGRSLEDVTRAFFLVGEATYLDWLGSRLSEVTTTTRWHRWALQALEEDLRLTRRQVAEKVLGEGDVRAPVEEALVGFLERREEAMTRLGRFMRGIAVEEASDLAALTVAVRQVRALSA
jgi:glutamate dehydrogenase